MAYKVTKNKAESLEQLKILINAFEKEYAALKRPDYKETPLRNDFLNPLLKTFGWDVENEAASSQFLRDVVQEETIDVEEEDAIVKKSPDYTLRVRGTRKLFIEAKKVSIDIERSNRSAFQTRRYGWNAKLGISILTNFEKIVVYDCRYKPAAGEDPQIARYRVFHFSEFLKHFDSLYQLLSFDSIASGFIDDYFSDNKNDAITFDDYFLRQIETWRQRLASEILKENGGFNEEDINFLIQRLLNRIIFLRICEDREIEKYETLKAVKNYDDLKSLFQRSDKRYNSGLFDFIEDNFSLKISLDSKALINIFSELYYPESPYDFSVVDPTILSQIYERYLGSKITMGTPTSVSIVEEPEVAYSSGVVPTPKFVVENIVKETLATVLDSQNLRRIQLLKIADICCGSGTFLISVYDYLLEKITLFYISENTRDKELTRQSSNGILMLTLKAKQTILVNNIYGVDINPYATEVAKFSLLLKLLENENAASVDDYLAKYNHGVLPDLSENIKTGNSLVDANFFKFSEKALHDDQILHKVKPFTWEREFPFLKETGGFDAIVGNPPYIRIQNMVKYQPEEVKYYQSSISDFTVATAENFDKYYLFIQKGIKLLNPNGVLGYIVPNKFFILRSGIALRGFISSNASINKIIHFGVTQIFPNRSTYTAIIILDKKKREQFGFKRVKRVNTDFVAGSINYTSYSNSAYNDYPWIFISDETEAIFAKVRASGTIKLEEIAEIPVGLQTSADKVYIFQPYSETETTFKFRKNNTEHEVEKGICKPCLYDLSFDLFDTVEPNAQLIFPYLIQDGKAVLLSEEDFSTTYPLTWSYLNSFRGILSKRSINGSKKPEWYQYGRSQSLTKFHSAGKLIWPVLSTKPNYIYDINNLQFTGGGNGPYYSLVTKYDYSPLYILAILAHPVMEAMVKAGASEFQGAYYSHGKQFISEIPIRDIDFADQAEKKKHDDIVRIAEEIIDTKQSHKKVYQEEKKRALHTKIDYLSFELYTAVNQLYGITEAQIATALDDDIFLTDDKEE